VGVKGVVGAHRDKVKDVEKEGVSFRQDGNNPPLAGNGALEELLPGKGRLGKG